LYDPKELEKFEPRLKVNVSSMSFVITYNPREDYVKDELQVILRQESTTYYAKKSNYFALSSLDCNDRNKQVNEGWRRKVCEWLFEVVDHFQFDREVVLFAVCFLDRAASIETKKLGKSLNPRQFQIIAATCFYIAIKLHGEVTPDVTGAPRCKLKIETMVALSRALLTVEELEEKELEILDELDWRVNPTTSIGMIASLLHFLPNGRKTTKKEIYEISRYLAEISACVSAVAFHYKPSEIAYAGILCAFDTLGADAEIPCAIRVEFTKKVHASTGMTPQSMTTLKCLLKDLCPSMFPEEDCYSSLEESKASCDAEGSSSSKKTSDEHGKNSPTCVLKFPAAP